MDLRPTIRELCKKRGISLSQVERDCGFASGSISHWDTKVPSVERVGRVADYFDVSVDYLMGRQISLEEISGVSGAYLSFAKSAEESGIAPEDLDLLLKAVQSIQNRK